MSSEYIKDRRNRIESRKKLIGSKHYRKITRYSDNFNRMFKFFFLLNRSSMIDFCGTKTDIFFDNSGPSAKECFRLYEDGFYREGKRIVTRHPNLLKSTLIGKKGWGLWVQEWTDGIAEMSFTLNEIMDQFKERGVDIPDPMMDDFKNVLYRKRIKYINENRKSIFG